MAKQTITLCDVCGKKDAAQVTFATQSDRMIADLCGGCVKRLVKDYHFSEMIHTNRTRRVWDFDEIPRNTLQ